MGTYFFLVECIHCIIKILLKICLTYGHEASYLNNHTLFFEGQGGIFGDNNGEKKVLKIGKKLADKTTVFFSFL